jgi:hypothetical protein
MQCPLCTVEMELGKTSVESAPTSLILGLVSAVMGHGSGPQQYLYFHPADGEKGTCVFEGTREAFRCSNCQIHVIGAKTRK